MKKQMMRWLAAFMLVLSLVQPVFAKQELLIPGGYTVGIRICSQGLVVTGFERNSAAKEAGLRKGDVILTVNEKKVATAEELRQHLTEKQVVLHVLRGDKEAQFCVRPARTAEGGRLGVFVRDSISGIGTVTWVDPETGDYGALGHGVNDADAEILLPLESGVVVASSVENVVKGKCGDPGELQGKFDVHKILGTVEQNTERGIFGVMDLPAACEPLPVADLQEVEPGAAVIRCNVDGTSVQEYSVEILKIYPHAGESGRDLLLSVTDQRLLQKTGGIVQGMSGSPIIQDGKLVGAVTHVLVNDPTRGYGIIIENMLDAAE